MKEWGIQIASERRMRQSKRYERGVKPTLFQSLLVFFCLQVWGKGDEDCSRAPLVYITTLNSKSGGVPR